MTLKATVPGATVGADPQPVDLTTLPSYTDQEQTVTQSAIVLLNNGKTTHTWRSLPKYDANGKPITYAVEETGIYYKQDESSLIPVANYSEAFEVTSAPNADGTVFTIDNTPKATSIQVTKMWTLNGRARTDKTSITYELRRTDSETALALTGFSLSADNGEAVANKISYVEGTGWQTVTISGLPKYELVIDQETEPATATYSLVNYYVVETTDAAGNTRVTYDVAPTGAVEPEATSGSPESGETNPPEGGETVVPDDGEKADPSEAVTNDGKITICNRDTDLSLKILKVDSTNTSMYLVGAEFQLLKKNGESSYVAYTQSAFTDSPYSNESEAKLVIEDRDEGIAFQMLSDGDYMLEETKTPDGYVKLVPVEIEFNVVDGAITPAITEGGDIVVDYAPATEDDGPVVTIANTPGVSLPSTGGPGTTIFYVLGSVLTLLAAVLLVTKRRAETLQRD